MFAAVTSVVLVGVEPRPVRVEAHVTSGRSSIVIVGLPDAAVREARERVRAALRSSGIALPSRRIVVNLSPADVPKSGSAYDLPMAVAILAACGETSAEVTRMVTLGELALDGHVRHVRGGFAAALVAREVGLPCVLPPAAAAEAVALPGAGVRAVTSLPEALAVAVGRSTGSPIPELATPDQTCPDLGEVRGQLAPRRALEVAAAGGHHLLMTGAPGAGKTMLARCLPGLLPGLTPEAAHEMSLVWTAAGRLRGPIRSAPFRAPHHSATLASLVGGGSGVPVPGEVSLAHRGVLFLDELGEFPPHLLDALRQPIEDQSVVVARKGASVRFPTSVQMVAATNPCPCGYAGDRLVACRCTPRAVDKYRRRLSGPLLDRFDMRVRLGRVEPGELAASGGEPSPAVRTRVLAARTRQEERGRLNRELTGADLDRLEWDGDAMQLLEDAVDGQSLTARGWNRVRRVAVTIADLDEAGVMGSDHVGEALGYRSAA
ncbi:MAG: YifB family Mg chelatase-like AAA ATPase [Acidimicrobiia bacterium]